MLKKQILFDYCDEYKKTPKNKIIIGKWLGNQKSKINLKTDQMYLDLSSNKYVKESLDNYYLKNKKVEKITMSKEEKKKLLFDYCNKYKKTPPQKIIYKKINSKTYQVYLDLSSNEYVKKSLDQYLAKKK